MGVKAAEDYVTHCHRCGKAFGKADVRIPTFRENRYWCECLGCFETLGGATWTGKAPTITIERG